MNGLNKSTTLSFMQFLLQLKRQRCQWVWSKFPEMTRNFLKMHMNWKKSWNWKFPEDWHLWKENSSVQTPFHTIKKGLDCMLWTRNHAMKIGTVNSTIITYSRETLYIEILTWERTDMSRLDGIQVTLWWDDVIGKCCPL